MGAEAATDTPARRSSALCAAFVAIRAVEIERPAAEAGIAMLARGGDFADGVVRHEADRATTHDVRPGLRDVTEKASRDPGPRRDPNLEPGLLLPVYSITCRRARADVGWRDRAPRTVSR